MAQSKHRGELVVVGTGIQCAGQASMAAQYAIERADRVLFAVVDPWTVAWVRRLNPAAESLPYPMDDSPRSQTYARMVDRILVALGEHDRVCAVFYGHPGVLTDAAHAAVIRARAAGHEARMLPGISALDCLYTDMGIDPGREGCQVYEATDFLLRPRAFDVHSHLIICQIGFIGNFSFFDSGRQDRIRRGLAILTERLRPHYGADHEVILYEAATLPTASARRDRLPLSALADARVTDLTTLYLPPLGPAPMDPDMAMRLGVGPLSNPTES